MDPRIEKLASNIVHHSCTIERGEKVLIHYIDPAAEPLVRQLMKEIYKVGAIPFIKHTVERVLRQQLLECSKEQMEMLAKWDRAQMEEMDVYIGVSGRDNSNELGDVPSDKMQLYNKYYMHPVHHEVRVPKTKWVVLRYPNGAMAQRANKSTEDFENFYFNVCNLDYDKMSIAMDSLVELMEKTDQVHIKGPGTDLHFSIKGIPVIKCAGEANLPDGEVYTAPVRDSVNGTLRYNCPALYQGTTYEDICLEFKDGKIIQATSNDTEKINQVFDTDEGARYIGEFALGVNPYITEPMKETLFDEKIMGSFHFTPGKAYEIASNGNISSIHWDLVCIQTPEYGGGEIYFDGVLIRKDGRFVLPELESLNPENLK